MIERVLSAAARLIFSTAIFLGGIMVRSRPFFSNFTPMLSITSIKRFTSSIWGTFFKTVLPLLIKEAISKATAAFFELFTIASPLSFFPPWISKYSIKIKLNQQATILSSWICLSAFGGFQDLVCRQLSEIKIADSETRQPCGIAMEFRMTKKLNYESSYCSF